MVFFLISSVVLGLLVQLLIFSQLYMIELLGLLKGLGLLELWHLISPRLLTGFGMLAFFTKLIKSYGISGQILGLISFFLSNRQLQVVADGKSSQEYPVNAEFLKAPFLVLHFSYYTLMIFWTMRFMILLYMLMILLSMLSMIGHLICGNNLNWLLNLNLIYETLWTRVKSCLLISMLGKLSWFCLTSLITIGLLM